MPKFERFEDIHAWQKSRELVKNSYAIFKKEDFKKDYSLIDQMKRASISVMANIAEGFARRTSKEFINFLGIAHASMAEYQSHLYVSLDQKYISQNEFGQLYGNADEISKMIQGLIKYLRKL